MSWDFFFRTENKNFHSYWADRPAHQIRLDIPNTFSLSEAIESAHEAGVPKGSSRSGVFEVHNDDGIFQNLNANSIEHHHPKNTIFKTWEQLEREMK